MALANARRVLTAKISGSPDRNLANDPPRRQGTEKSDTLTLLCRVFKGYVFSRETSMGAMDGEGVLRGIGKKFFFDYFTPGEYIDELVIMRQYRPGLT